ncbi:hypothetical protein KAR91_22090 [Candidatus Pacearchaeota archaeon]|nr:hypothetical protein [Candidatus Pacearchaeota archaeon]
MIKKRLCNKNFSSIEDMVEELSHINSDAVTWILKNKENKCMSNLPNCLLGLFNWGESPQGHNYWQDLFFEVTYDE